MENIYSSVRPFTILLYIFGLLPTASDIDFIFKRRLIFKVLGVLFSICHFCTLMYFIILNAENDELYDSTSLLLSYFWKSISFLSTAVMMVLFAYQLVKLGKIKKFLLIIHQFDESVSRVKILSF